MVDGNFENRSYSRPGCDACTHIHVGLLFEVECIMLVLMLAVGSSGSRYWDCPTYNEYAHFRSLLIPFFSEVDDLWPQYLHPVLFRRGKNEMQRPLNVNYGYTSYQTDVNEALGYQSDNGRICMVEIIVQTKR